jgi:hypothetical protein
MGYYRCKGICEYAKYDPQIYWGGSAHTYFAKGYRPCSVCMKMLNIDSHRCPCCKVVFRMYLRKTGIVSRKKKRIKPYID